ncbi:MAG: hypothetical protein IKC32_06475 [Clostridia bacterium]|nr:hypothetical protein [Clostridia bacterium]
MKKRIAIVDGRISEECLRALMLRGFRVITLPPCSTLSEPIASHPDMLIAKVKDELVTTSDYCEEAAFAISEIYDEVRLKFHFTADSHGKSYPDDVIFNSLPLGNRLFARLESLSPYLKELAEANGLELINVSQGYPACTTLKLSDEAVITADPGMEKLLSSYGIRVYRIENGGIQLPPYEYGFIGGAAGVFGGCAYFLGDASLHPSHSIIKEALDRESIKPIMLSDAPLTDLGGILFIEADLD